jgi:hypothetical protein
VGFKHVRAIIKIGLLVTLLLWLVGCAAKPTLYAWGRYEELIYLSYARPDKTDLVMQVGQMEQDYQKARAENKSVPPGFHAYLGLLYFQLGKMEQAQQEFMNEKKQFPESAVFMDRLMSRLQ